MFALIFVLLIVVPLLELFVIVQVAQATSTLWTIVALLAVSTIGAWLVRREGTGVYGRIRKQLEQGQMPSEEIANAALIMFGGTLLLTPGFVTDAIGLGLLIPPIRAVVRRIIMKRVALKQKEVTARMVTNLGTNLGSNLGGATFGTGMSGFRRPGEEVIDVDVVRNDPPPPSELGQ